MLKVVVTAYNAQEWIGKCISSIRNQTVEFDCVLVDDCSTDRTGDIMEDMKDFRFNTIHLDVNMKGVLPRIIGIAQGDCDIEDIIVLVDGDDWLFRDDALEKIAKRYEEGAWATYGQYVYASGGSGICREYPSDVIRDGTYRHYGWLASHPKSFKKFLYDKIDTKDFYDKNTGKHLEYGVDMAFMFPILEMARERVHCLPDVLYTYNDLSSGCVFVHSREEQVQAEKVIRGKKIYGRLN